MRSRFLTHTASKTEKKRKEKRKSDAFKKKLLNFVFKKSSSRIKRSNWVELIDVKNWIITMLCLYKEVYFHFFISNVLYFHMLFFYANLSRLIYLHCFCVVFVSFNFLNRVCRKCTSFPCNCANVKWTLMDVHCYNKSAASPLFFVNNVYYVFSTDIWYMVNTVGPC